MNEANIKLKFCKECKETKPETDFAPNQYGKNNRILRRPVCKKCYKRKTAVKPIDRDKFILENPKPKIGENFKCPVCCREFIREHNNDVVLDHHHVTGVIRGWLCSSCNTSIGKFKEDVSILKRAIDWIVGTLK